MAIMAFMAAQRDRLIEQKTSFSLIKGSKGSQNNRCNDVVMVIMVRLAMSLMCFLKEAQDMVRTMT